MGRRNLKRTDNDGDGLKRLEMMISESLGSVSQGLKYLNLIPAKF